MIVGKKVDLDALEDYLMEERRILWEESNQESLQDALDNIPSGLSGPVFTVVKGLTERRHHSQCTVMYLTAEIDLTVAIARFRATLDENDIALEIFWRYTHEVILLGLELLAALPCTLEDLIAINPANERILRGIIDDIYG